MFKKLDALSGELLATQVAIRALILDSNNSLNCNKNVATSLEKVYSSMLSKSLTEDTLNGFEKAKNAILLTPAQLATLAK